MAKLGHNLSHTMTLVAYHITLTATLLEREMRFHGERGRCVLSAAMRQSSWGGGGGRHAEMAQLPSMATQITIP